MEQERIECWSTQNMAHACGEALRLEQERKKCWSTQDMAHACGEALGSEEEMLND